MNTIEQAYEEYVAELTRYREWTDETIAKYHSHSPMEDWGNSDYEKVTTWNAQLKTARQVLGLTETEDEEADQRAGIKRYSEAASR